MNELILKATSNRLEIEKDTYTTGGSVNFDCCVFTFDEIWDGFNKTAVFGFGNSDYARVELKDDECKIPSMCIQDEGILKIAVYGVNNDGVVITTNAVAHRVNEGIGEVNNWYEEDNLFVYNAMKEIEGSLEKYKEGLDTKFGELLKMLRRKGSVSDSDVVQGEPDEWYCPGKFVGSENLPKVLGNEKYEAYLDHILNVLKIDFPEYVTAKKIGVDESGEFPIYAYTFEPLDYEKTIFITATLRGGSDVTLVSLSFFLDELCRNFKEDRTLSYIRSKVKLVVVPVANPYGFVNGTRFNANGVDLQRNFPYKWFECSSDVKGERPSDQSEIMALSMLIYEFYKDKFCAALDLNETNSLHSGKMMFYPRFKSSCISAISDALERYNYEHDEDDTFNKTVFAASVNPTVSNFLAEFFGVNSCTVAWPTELYADNDYNDSVTKYAELIGNLLYTLAKNSTYTIKKQKLPFIKHFSWRSSGNEEIYEIKTQKEKVPITSFELDVEKPCCMSLTGYVIVIADSYCNVKLNPVLWQEDAPEQGYDERLAMDSFSIELPLSPGVCVLPLETVLQAYCSDTNDEYSTAYPKKVRFSLVAESDDKASAGISGFSLSLKAFESDVGKSVEVSRPMGLATDYENADDIPTQEIIYPLEIVTERDADYDD